MNFGFGLQGRFSSPSSIMGLHFKILGSPGPPEGDGVPGLALLTCAPLFPARLCRRCISSLQVANEPVLVFTQGSPERDALQKVMGTVRGTQ